MGRTFRKCYLPVTDWEEAGNSADAKIPRHEPDFQLTTQKCTTRRARDNQFPSSVRTPGANPAGAAPSGFALLPLRHTTLLPVRNRWSEERGPKRATVLKSARTHLQVS